MSVLLFAISMATITLQVVQVRILSYTINHAFVYMAISLAMVGFGVSGTVLSVLRPLLAIPPRRSVAACSVLFALTSLIAHAVFARVSHLIVPAEGLSVFSKAAGLLLVFAVPYFFAGMGVALALLSDVSRVSRSYFVNLIGSAAGCFAVYPFLREVGAERIVVGISLLVSLVAYLAGKGVWRAAALVAVALSGFAWLLAGSVMPFRPDDSDQYRHARRAFEAESGCSVDTTLEFERWDPVGKIEIFRFPWPYNLFGGEADSLFFSQDAGAGSVLLGLADHPEMADAMARGTLWGAATVLRPDADVLVVGLGGGGDLLGALHNGARRVTGVEINAGTLEALGERYREFLGLPPPESDRLNLVMADGRGYVRRFRDRFDVVQMTGADTYAASVTGGSMLAENYLYTVEAFVDYLRAVKPDGIVSIGRVSWESIKVVMTMLEALRELGIDQPQRHIAMLGQGTQETSWAAVLTKPTPFTTDEIAQLEQLCADSERLGPRCKIPVYEKIGFRIDAPIVMAYAPDLVRTYEKSELATLERACLGREDVNFDPATDDQPFFLNHRRFDMSLGQLFSRRSLTQYSFNVADYLVIAIQITVIALVLILGPLAIFKLRGRHIVASAPLLVYFFGIGIGFMFLEIVLMQKCGLFLGHPNYSISTVLFSLLVFSGLGSYIAGQIDARPGTKIGVAVVGISAWVVLFSWLSQDIFTSLLHLDIAKRIAIQVGLTAPVGLLAGVPFPTCLQQVDRAAPHLGPWALGTNGFASVLASLAAIPTTMAIGFSSSLYVAVAAYLLAWIGFVVFRKV